MDEFPGLSGLQQLLKALDEPHIPGPAERAQLEAALVHLIAAYDLRDFQPGEEAQWHCGQIKIAGVERGAWEITLRQTPPSE